MSSQHGHDPRTHVLIAKRLVVVALVGIWASPLSGSEQDAPMGANDPALNSDSSASIIAREHVDFFEAKIRPVLSQHCYKCHSAGAEEVKAGLYLDSRDGVERGGDSGPIIERDTPANSSLLQALRHENLEMPPDGKLPDRTIADFERWVRLGAPDPRSEKVPTVNDQKMDWSRAREFWSFRKPTRPPLPKVEQQQHSINAIDTFVLRRLQEQGLALNPPADRRSLIRRAYYDLIGLPPSPEEVNDFVMDSSPQAYDELVDRLLASPHYGERWGRHWLDVAGYAESNGIIGDGLTPHAWRYRDYVIRALNKDKPYDRFLLEQFAGDELVPWQDSEQLTEEMVEALTATGFLRCTPDGTDNQDIYQLEKRWDHIHATVEVALKASMGIVLNCARCHDHKFDPVMQEDYYKVVGLFLPAYDPENWVPCTDQRKYYWPVRYILNAGKSRREQAMQTMTDLGQRIKSLNREQRDLVACFHDQWLIVKGEAGELLLSTQELSALRLDPNDRSAEEARIAANLRSEHDVADTDLRERFPDYRQRVDDIKSQLRATREQAEEADLDRIWALWDVSTQPPKSHLLRRGDFMSPGRVVPTGIPKIFGPDAPFNLPEPTPRSTGYRLAFACWLVHPNHPLTARVMVNRIWQYHFGRGIVATPDDFGSQGARPTHPELLDWLATEFIEGGWSIKRLHRLIMTSATYRQSSQSDPHKIRVDSDNRWLSRWRPRRLEAEVIRDAMLAIGGSLDSRLFGPAVPLEQLEDGQYVVSTNDPGKQRRSVYIRVRRTTPVSFLETFDSPQVDTNVPRRFSSTVPLQSLSLMNNPFVVQSALNFAQRLSRTEGNNEQRIKRAFEITFSRGPDDQEVAISQALLSDGDGDADWALFCHGLIASNEFLYIH